MADSHDQRVRLAVVAAVAAGAGVGILLWSQHRRRANAQRFCASSAPGYSTGYSSSPDRADSTQPVTSRWSASGKEAAGTEAAPAITESAPAGGAEPSVSESGRPETHGQDSDAEHTWVAFESTGQLAAAAAAAAPLGSDASESGQIDVQEDGGDVGVGGVGGQPQPVVLPPENSAARAQARSNLASIYSTVGAALPPKQKPQRGVPQRSPSGTLSSLTQPTVSSERAASGAEPAAARLNGLPEQSHSAGSPAVPMEGASRDTTGGEDQMQRSTAVGPSVDVVPGDGAALPLWQRLLALTAAGVEADDERDDERDNNDTDAGPHEVSISSEWIAESARQPERQPEQLADAAATSGLRRTSAGLPPVFPRPSQPAHVEASASAVRRLVRMLVLGCWVHAPPVLHAETTWRKLLGCTCRLAHKCCSWHMVS